MKSGLHSCCRSNVSNPVEKGVRERGRQMEEQTVKFDREGREREREDRKQARPLHPPSGSNFSLSSFGNLFGLLFVCYYL